MPKLVLMGEQEKDLFDGVVFCPITNKNCYAWGWKSNRCDDCPLVPSSSSTVKEDNKQ